MPCGWEGNRRSGVALAMRHRLQWYIHLRDHGLRKGDECVCVYAYALLVEYGPFTFPYLITYSVAEWLACWTQAQKGLGSNRSRDAVV